MYNNIYITCMLNRFSCVLLFAILWTVTCQVLLSMGFSRQEYWSGLLSPPPGDLPDPGIEPAAPAAPAGGFFTTEPPGKPKCPLALHIFGHKSIRTSPFPSYPIQFPFIFKIFCILKN